MCVLYYKHIYIHQNIQIRTSLVQLCQLFFLPFNSDRGAKKIRLYSFLIFSREISLFSLNRNSPINVLCVRFSFNRSYTEYLYVFGSQQLYCAPQLPHDRRSKQNYFFPLRPPCLTGKQLNKQQQQRRRQKCKSEKMLQTTAKLFPTNEHMQKNRGGYCLPTTATTIIIMMACIPYSTSTVDFFQL